jgi:formyltetrahydrofolate deformylase
VDTDRPGHDFVLVLSCPDGPGIVAEVSGYLAAAGCNIAQSQQFGDPDSGRFFMRVQFTPVGDATRDAAELASGFAPVADRFHMTWRLVDNARRPRVLIMVSGHGHCLNDLLYRHSIGTLRMDVPAVVSNHTDLGWLADNFAVPFHHIPVGPHTRTDAEAELAALLDDLDIDLVVLARYMQVLSPDLCKRLEGRAINIHHSMLPSFKGARPYQQAHDRGVKLVGATAHYVTTDLDEGPIIEQDVARVDHTMTVDELVAAGRDVECQVLARAVRWHIDNRVVLNGPRTVVLR